MDINRPEIERLVWWWAWTTARKCSKLDASDLAQELWVEALVAREEWDPEQHAALSSYLYPRLKWKAMNLLKAHCNRSKHEDLYASATEKISGGHGGSLESVIPRVRGLLSQTDAQVFDVMVDPPAELHQIARELNHIKKDLKPSSRTTTMPTDSHVAYFLGVSAMTVSRAMKQIKHVLEQEVNDDQKEGQRIKAQR